MSEKPSHHSDKPENHVPPLADQKADFALWAEELGNTSEMPDQRLHDQAETREMEAGLSITEQAEATQKANEAAARKKLAAIQEEMPAQVATHDRQAAHDREQAKTAQVDDAIAKLHQNFLDSRLKGPTSIIEPSADDTFHREVYQKIFAQLGLPDPVPELEADKRSRLRKLFQPKNRKSVTVEGIVATGDSEPVFIAAHRSYSKVYNRYELRLFGGKTPADQKVQTDSHEPKIAG